MSITMPQYEDLGPDDITVVVRGVDAGTISPLVLQTLAETGLLKSPYDTLPQQRLREMPDTCFCGEPRKYGVFCAAHFEWLRANYGFALAWEREKVWWQAQAEAQGVQQ